MSRVPIYVCSYSKSETNNRGWIANLHSRDIPSAACFVVGADGKGLCLVQGYDGNPEGRGVVGEAWLTGCRDKTVTTRSVRGSQGVVRPRLRHFRLRNENGVTIWRTNIVETAEQTTIRRRKK